jgi:hypothetical protein
MSDSNFFRRSINQAQGGIQTIDADANVADGATTVVASDTNAAKELTLQSAVAVGSALLVVINEDDVGAVTVTPAAGEGGGGLVAVDAAGVFASSGNAASGWVQLL